MRGSASSHLASLDGKAEDHFRPVAKDLSGLRLGRKSILSLFAYFIPGILKHGMEQHATFSSYKKPGSRCTVNLLLEGLLQNLK
jgi:hypothetical protein